jgi:hypothetical protein
LLFAIVALVTVVFFDMAALLILDQGRFIRHGISEFERELIFVATPIVISFVISIFLGAWRKGHSIFSRFVIAVSCFAFPVFGAYAAIVATCKMACP